jgi:hypothetical protein
VPLYSPTALVQIYVQIHGIFNRHAKSVEVFMYLKSPVSAF